MKKKLIVLILVCLIVLALGTTALAADIQPSTASVFVNGVQFGFPAYNIDGYNYFKLRDIAYALDYTIVQFDLKWDEAEHITYFSHGEHYTPIGDELLPLPPDAHLKDVAIVEATTDAAGDDGGPLILHGYNIGGYKFFKLRDILGYLGVNPGWDAVNKVITIDTPGGFIFGQESDFLEYWAGNMQEQESNDTMSTANELDPNNAVNGHLHSLHDPIDAFLVDCEKGALTALLILEYDYYDDVNLLYTIDGEIEEVGELLYDKDLQAWMLVLELDIKKSGDVEIALLADPEAAVDTDYCLIFIQE